MVSNISVDRRARGRVPAQHEKRIAATSALVAISIMPFSATAAPKDGCPATSSGWESGTVEAVAKRIFDALVGGASRTPEEFVLEIDGYDRNDDGDVCLVIRWGDHLNPKSNWYASELFVVSDNNSNASGR